MLSDIATKTLENLTITSEAMVLFIVAYLANIMFSLYYNVTLVGQEFDRTRLIKSFIKAIIFALGLTMLILVITGLPVFMNAMGLNLPQEYQEVFNNLVIIITITSVTIKYTLESFEKFRNILGFKKEEE